MIGSVSEQSMVMQMSGFIHTILILKRMQQKDIYSNDGLKSKFCYISYDISAKLLKWGLRTPILGCLPKEILTNTQMHWKT